jgi:hypothetical protein
MVLPPDTTRQLPSAKFISPHCDVASCGGRSRMNVALAEADRRLVDAVDERRGRARVLAGAGSRGTGTLAGRRIAG